MTRKMSLRRLLKLAAAVCLAVTMTFSGYAGGISYAASDRPYFLAATYCSDEWVITFWNSESADMETELQQIAADGFNCIILAVPWREFQPSMEPVRYEEYAFDKLNRVMDAAGRHGLDVMFRVGYTWDYSKPEGQDGILERYRRLLYDDTARAAWRDYVSTLYQTAAVYPNFAGGFLTWEDFWNFVESAGSYGRGRDSREMAEKIGYSSYVAERYSWDEINALYGADFGAAEDIYLPSQDSPAFRLFFEFYDTFLNEILLESQQVFPNLSMEVRLDVDPVPDGEGGYFGSGHQSTFGCGSSSFTSAMYSVSMGREEDSRITADEAVRTMDQILGLTQIFNGGKPIFVDQFLFMDNTPGFEKNGRLIESEIPAFIVNSSDVLRRRSKGYGIWTYRDYCDSVVYNAQFGLDEKGWNFQGEAYVMDDGGNKRAYLPSRSAIVQDFNVQLKKGSQVHVQFSAAGDEGSHMTVNMGTESRTVALSEEKKVYSMEFPARQYESVTFRSQGNAWVDDVKVYTFVTQSEVYHFNGSPGMALDAVRELNRLLKN